MTLLLFYLCCIYDITNEQHITCLAGLFGTGNDMAEGSSALSPVLISAAVHYIETAANHKDHENIYVYVNAQNDKVDSRRLKAILHHKWLSENVSHTANYY